MTNIYGLDTNYLKAKLEIFLRDVESYTPKEAARVLVKVALFTSKDAVMKVVKELENENI